MGIISFPIKTHSREDITTQFELNDCIIHHCKPKIYKIVSGRRKYIDFVAVCKEDACNKISDDVNITVEAWNKWNPKQ